MYYVLSKSEYKNWKSDEPNDAGGNEDCVHLTSSNEWNDKSCTATRAYICKKGKSGQSFCNRSFRRDKSKKISFMFRNNYGLKNYFWVKYLHFGLQFVVLVSGQCIRCMAERCGQQIKTLHLQSDHPCQANVPFICKSILYWNLIELPLWKFSIPVVLGVHWTGT